MNENDPKEAKIIYNLTRKQYNDKIGLQRQRRWIKKRKKNNSQYKEALDQMSEDSLKVADWTIFRENLKIQRKCYEVLKHLYSSNAFTKMSWIRERQKESFTEKFINDFVSKCKQETKGNDFVVAYGNGSFALSMKGMDGGGSSHRRLMILLSKRVRVVMTDEYRTTKACSVCKNFDIKMKCPKGKATYHSHRLKKEFRKNIHGLSHCKCCKKLFSRDYIASMNICRSFVSYFQYGVPLDYLRKTTENATK